MKRVCGPWEVVEEGRGFLSAEDESGFAPVFCRRSHEEIRWAEQSRETQSVIVLWISRPDTLRILTQQIPLSLGVCVCVYVDEMVRKMWRHVNLQTLCECMFIMS